MLSIRSFNSYTSLSSKYKTRKMLGPWILLKRMQILELGEGCIKEIYNLSREWFTTLPPRFLMTKVTSRQKSLPTVKGTHH